MLCFRFLCFVKCQRKFLLHFYDQRLDVTDYIWNIMVDAFKYKGPQKYQVIIEKTWISQL